MSILIVTEQEVRVDDFLIEAICSAVHKWLYHIANHKGLDERASLSTFDFTFNFHIRFRYKADAASSRGAHRK